MIVIFLTLLTVRQTFWILSLQNPKKFFFLYNTFSKNFQKIYFILVSLWFFVLFVEVFSYYIQPNYLINLMHHYVSFMNSNEVAKIESNLNFNYQQLTSYRDQFSFDHESKITRVFSFERLNDAIFSLYKDLHKNNQFLNVTLIRIENLQGSYLFDISSAAQFISKVNSAVIQIDALTYGNSEFFLEVLKNSLMLFEKDLNGQLYTNFSSINWLQNSVDFLDCKTSDQDLPASNDQVKFHFSVMEAQTQKIKVLKIPEEKLGSIEDNPYWHEFSKIFESSCR